MCPDINNRDKSGYEEGLESFSVEGFVGSSKKGFDLTNKNVEYLDTHQDRVTSRDLYDGGSAVKRKGDVYLFKTPLEAKNVDDETFKFRLKRATIDPWVKKIVIARNSLIHHKPASRELDTSIEKYEKAVNLNGMGADEFFENVCENAQVDGISWVLTDMPEKPNVHVVDGIKPPIDEFAVQDLELNLNNNSQEIRPFFQMIPGDRVLDWAVGADGRLLWAVVEEDFSIRDDEGIFGYKQIFQKQWKAWFRDGWLIFRLKDSKAKQNKEFVLVSGGVNPTGFVPLEPFLGIKNTEFSGFPVCRSVLGHVIKIYNKESDLDYYEYYAAHPLFYTIGPKAPSKWDVAKGFHLYTSDDSASTASVGLIETSGNGFASIRESIKDLIYRVISTMLAQAKRDSAQVQSADSQREDKRTFNSSIRGAAVSYEQAEERCWRHLWRWENQEKEILSIEQAKKIADVAYNKDYDDKTIDVAMVKEMKEMAALHQLPVETLWQILFEGEALPADFDFEKAKVLLELDIARSAAASAIHEVENENEEED